MRKLHYAVFLFCAAFVAATIPAHAKLVAKNVAYSDGETKLQGYFVYDDQYTGGGKKLPGVLVAPEWWGINDYVRRRAQQLAGLGYAAFVVDMYGEGKLTTDPKIATGWSGDFYSKPTAMAARARAGLEALTANSVVDVRKLAAVGYCFGGAVCQSLAYDGAPLAGVVSFHGSLIAASSDDAARTKANGVRLLICQGAVDPFIKPDDYRAFKDALDSGGVDYQLILYSGAQHAFTNSGADELSKISGLQGIAYNASADKHSWEHMRIFLSEIFSAQQ